MVAQVAGLPLLVLLPGPAGPSECVKSLRLIALALRGRQDTQAIAELLDTFSGGHCYLVEYLVADVLAAQPEPLQEFLLQTSVLGRLTASHSDPVTGQTDGADLLEQVERANLLLLPLDVPHDTPDDGAAQWYRYHALFAEAMRHEACRLGDDSLRTCSASRSQVCTRAAL